MSEVNRIGPPQVGHLVAFRQGTALYAAGCRRGTVVRVAATMNEFLARECATLGKDLEEIRAAVSAQLTESEGVTLEESGDARLFTIIEVHPCKPLPAGLRLPVLRHLFDIIGDAAEDLAKN